MEHGYLTFSLSMLKAGLTALLCLTQSGPSTKTNPFPIMAAIVGLALGLG